MNEEIYARILTKNRAEVAAQRSQEQPSAAPATEAEEAQPVAVDSTSMAEFAQQHRSGRLPRIQRQHELVQKQRHALYGHDETRLRSFRGEWE